MGSKQDKIAAFNPNNAGLADSQIYGLPFTPEESDIVLLPVPWEVTVSYGSGASEGPEHIFDASFQIDLFHPEFPELWKKGIAMLDASAGMHGRANALKEKAQQIIDAWEEAQASGQWQEPQPEPAYPAAWWLIQLEEAPQELEPPLRWSV